MSLGPRAVQRPGPVVFAKLADYEREVVHAAEGRRMLVAEHFLLKRECPPVHHFGLVVIAEPVEHDREVVHALELPWRGATSWSGVSSKFVSVTIYSGARMWP